MNINMVSFYQVMESFAKIIVIHVVIIIQVVLCTGCTEPHPVLHAYRYIDNTSLPVGSWVNYTCYQNYYWISGDLKRECNGGGLTGQPPVCGEYKVLKSAHGAIFIPVSLGGLTDGDLLTCESTGSSTNPSWTIGFDGTKHVFSVELTVDMTSNVNINRIEVHVRNTTLNPSTLCGTINSPWPSYVGFICPSNLTGGHLVIQGSGTGELGLCEVKVIGKDWLYECGDPLFVYGAEVTGNKTVAGDVVVQYSCVEGFYYGGKNPESICRNGQWTIVDILCLPYDSLYNLKLSPFNTVYGPLVDDDENTCVEMADEVIATLNYKRLNFKIYSFKYVELLSVTVTIGVGETWDDIEFVGHPLGVIAYEGHETPLCEYDGLNTDPYRVRTFFCQPYAYTRVLFIIIRDISSNLKEFCEIKSTIRTDTNPLECIREEYINEYKGKMNYTWDGKHCDNWTDAPPEKAINTTIHKTFDPDSELNYCRNIGGEKKRPWCWVDNFQSIGYCPLAFCDEICNLKEEYTEYKGQQPFSTSGKQCRQWSDGNKEGREFLSEVFSDGVQAGSYCRNPGYSQFRAWCYVEDPVYTIVPEPCDVPHCPIDFLWLTVRNNETSIYPIYLHQCYNPLDSFNVQHYFDLTIEDSTINNLCRYFQDELLFCFTGGDWTRVEFVCFDVPPETTFIAETSSPSPETTLLMDETSTIFIEESSLIETSSIFEISSMVETSSSIVESSSIVVISTVADSSSVEASSPMDTSSSVEASTSLQISSTMDATSSVPTSSSVEASSLIETSSPEDESSVFTGSSVNGQTSFMDLSSTLKTTYLNPSFFSSTMDAASFLTGSSVNDQTSFIDLSSSLKTTYLNPSFFSSTMDAASETLSIDTTSNPQTVMDTPSNTPITISTTQTIEAASSTNWYASIINNDSRSNMTCGYFCIRNDLLNSSESVVRARIKFLTQSLEMDYDKLSATIRKRISAEDNRPSVTYVGSSALTMMVIFLVVVIFPDVINLFKFLHDRMIIPKTKGVRVGDTAKSGSQL